MTNNKTLGIGALILIVGLAVGYMLGGGSYRANGWGMMGGEYRGGAQARGGIDQHFIIQMIPHHEGAIEMAQLALERSKRPEMRALANAIIEAQQKEIDDMRSWYGDWFGAEVPAWSGFGGHGMGMMHMGGMEGDTSILASVAEADFDRVFILQMIPHHEMAVMMASMLGATSERPEMQQLAENIITSQSEEIETMRGWLNDWYGQ